MIESTPSAAIARTVQGRGPRLLFELYNEPHGRLDGEPWNVLAARALGAVRRTNPGRVVVLGPAGWNGAGELRRLAVPAMGHVRKGKLVIDNYFVPRAGRGPDWFITVTEPRP